ncbi:MAG: hypothetical protein AAB354_11395 [candidate division KSB1 bacterium]
MHLAYVSLLQIQRDLYHLPRGGERFQEYLRTMIDADTGELKLPLVAMNPMGKEHVSAFLERLLAMNADAVAGDALNDTRAKLSDVPGEYKAGLVVSDDLKGGWTNRYFAEFGYCFQQKPYYQRGWITIILWTSENYTPQLVREEMLTCLFRSAYVQRWGYARTLGEMLKQEGYARHNAGATTPLLEPEDLAYTREVLAPDLACTDYPTIIAALFGDAAAHQLGYQPLGLSPRAGLALGLSEARAHT